MPLDNIYRQQAALLIRTIPFVAPEECLALKGGTASSNSRMARSGVDSTSGQSQWPHVSQMSPL